MQSDRLFLNWIYVAQDASKRTRVKFTSRRTRSDRFKYWSRRCECLRGMVNSNLSVNIIQAVKHGSSCSISIMCFDNEIQQFEITFGTVWKRGIVRWLELGCASLGMLTSLTIIISEHASHGWTWNNYNNRFGNNIEQHQMCSEGLRKEIRWRKDDSCVDIESEDIELATWIKSA